TLGQVLSHLFQDLRKRVVGLPWPSRIWLVAHFNVADVTHLKDCDRLFRGLDAVRRTFCTVRRPLMLRLWDESNHDHPVSVIVRDTINLAPSGSKALRQLGVLIGTKKIELSPDEIDHMDKLLENDPKRFVEYALLDAKICAKFAYKMAILATKHSGNTG